MHPKLELESMEAELAAVEGLLAEASSLPDPVGLIQYTQRKQELEERIRVLRETEVHQANVALFFGGKPVFGSRGIAAEFAGKALEDFQELVSKQHAKAELGSLGERGRVPMKSDTTLMVTGVSHGSFGFILEELSEQNPMFDTALKENVTYAISIIESFGSDDESVFETAVEGLDKRTVIALKKFFINLDSNGATIRLKDDRRELSLDEVAVRRARIRIEATQTDEDERIIEGIVHGFLPGHRRFEFLFESGEMIYGSANDEAVDQFIKMIESGNAVIGKPAKIKVRERIIKPLNRSPKTLYRLLEFV